MSVKGVSLVVALGDGWGTDWGQMVFLFPIELNICIDPQEMEDKTDGDIKALILGRISDVFEDTIEELEK